MNVVENAVLGNKGACCSIQYGNARSAVSNENVGSLGRINAHKVRTGRLDPDDWPRLTSAVGLLDEAPLFIDDSPALSPLELRARAGASRERMAVWE
ncbi:MAG: hypothetical protein CM1200mP41_32930 [Gammaproteobacteria bacterium]|nr:MAG: hypothetical protein CM1200mP41_32930 [Gammaproteobacteria bacterium]